MNLARLERLCANCGIDTAYRDAWGEQRSVPIETRLALLAAMGVNVASDADIERALEQRETSAWRRPFPAVRVVRAAKAELDLAVALPEACAGLRFEWTLVREHGERRSGGFTPRDLVVTAQRRIAGAGFARFTFKLPELPEPGYHRIELCAPGHPSAPRAAMSLIVAPQRCYLPDAVRRGRVWGPMVNLYGLRSDRNWGIGDFSDLRALVELAACTGAGVVGVNPLHALFPHDPEHASPYSPASRLLLNALYLDPERVPEFLECAAARRHVASVAFQDELRSLRAADLVHYRRVAQLKLQVLELLYAHFRERHLERATERAQAFRAFQRAGGETLRLNSLFYALQEALYARDAAAWGWRAWPAEYRDPGSASVAEFARAHAVRTDYYDYLQWNAEQQLGAAGRRALELHLGVGIYLDLAVGADPGGAETWAQQALYADNVTVGCPPDEFNLNGQDWGIPPLLPEQLTEAAYAPFVGLLRANMQHAGALRIDHVMGLTRLFWVPAGVRPDRGGYVSYPAEDLFGVLALESERNHCMVIAEDLGTLPEGLADRLSAADILSYRLLYFQRDADDAFTAPVRYPPQALAAVSTHDLPPLRAFWLGRDLDLRTRLDLYPSEALRERQVVERAQDRARLLVALEREGMLPPGFTADPVSAPDMTPEFMLAVHRFLARAPSRLLTVQPEDIFGQLEQINVPATTAAQYPNWRHRLTLALERWHEDARFAALVETLSAERGSAPAPAELLPPRFETRIPDATYRLQFNRAFTFAQAAELVPYLHALGVSHCYASPYFSARPGSMHGYDIVDHNAFNPEIGGPEDFERFVQALRSHGMGQILDMVPNHMGVMGSDNAWWLDVLENGPASAFAAYFDIDWESPQTALRGKVLVPVLGDHYGTVLERGELQLGFLRASGAFSVSYHQHRFPVDPAEYPRILAARVERLEQRIGAQSPLLAEFQALVTAFRHLPPRAAADPEAVFERQRDKEVHKRHLARLCERSPDIAAYVEQTVQEINGTRERRASFDALDELLECQAYRLAYWRVASDEINYRRFFDINDLATLRIEDERVFEATHRLLFELLRDGKVDGVRIDHPDGLYDPLGYVRRLQERLAGVAAAANGDGSAPRPLYLVVEKILADFERLPEHWPVYGTTGYRFANLANALFVDAAAESQFDRIYHAFLRERVDYEALLNRTKLVIMKTALAAELSVLANRLVRIARADRHTRDFTLNSLREALAAVVAAFPVYRTYISGSVAAEDRRYIEWAVAVARRRGEIVDANVFEFVRRVLLGEVAAEDPDPRRRELLDFVMRFQQFTAPVAAKGMEDTAFYCYNRLASLNEVGGNPRCFGISLSAFHHASLDRARHWPHTMLATSTHDNKRSEDVRARIDALSEFPAEWWARLQRWRRINRRRKRQLEGVTAPSANDEYLLYQTLVGTWPFGNADEMVLARYRERIERYMIKAVREAKTHSSWMNVNEEYEAALREFISELLEAPGRNAFIADFAPFAGRIARVGMFNSLSQVVVKIASPGVPDFYQGNELWDFSLVDPDNRRSVDYGRRRQLLDELKARFACAPRQHAEQARLLLEHMEDGAIKLYVTWKGLALRRQSRALFANGEYVPLETRGEHADRICAFARVEGAQALVAVAPRLIGPLVAALGAPLGAPAWTNTCIVLPMRLAGSYCNVYTQERVVCDGAGELPVSDVLKAFPVALLAPAADGGL
ncbi:MAG: malto-oligosyltrehalose synthase [Betaproteobacteria bacterium]|nr:malto-oligosyltrehalose synthase [Betaproteobacteria bacterium]